MCGRFTQDTSWAEVRAFLQPIEFRSPEQQPAAQFNVAPTQSAWVVLPIQGVLSAQPMRWGLIPAWARDPGKTGYSTFNARIESAASKPTFRHAFRRHRALLLASGYYEWKTQTGSKQAHYIQDATAPLLCMAALWEPPLPSGPELPSFSILTCPATGKVAELHDRMPVMLQPEAGRAWIEHAPVQPLEWAQQYVSPSLAWHAVDNAVGNVRSQGPQLCQPLSRQTGLFE
ncbi:SOS response-associated peptidase [Pseudomarimonas arenosa]|uniref:Abasic site processing protein n=1 Tax=Pseudomarimonas arenosa TaxID=2774145 RepID=A0AAW3ZJA3_9GAMM|nr:SOS response-associated peptidase [Pseudomarimonas arenosa]MBD8524531.1 SOS response-associated peptidase [Pseudomarimonas arenosa]